MTKGKEVVLSESTTIRAPYSLGFGQAIERVAARSVAANQIIRTYRTLRTLILSNELNPAEPKTERFELRLSSELLTRVDEWRRAQTDLPSRSEAVRRLMEIGLSAQTATTLNKPKS